VTTDWNPSLYLRYADERTRPARELLARVPLDAVRSAVDLGCGPGNSTVLIAERYPDAALLGIDASEEMLRTARAELPGASFSQGDIADLSPDRRFDLVYSNAALQWLADHEALFPRLFRLVAPGGAFAAQMPDNLDEPSHRLMRETAADGPWASRIGDADKVRARILAADRYYDLLTREAAAVDIWRTTYHHVMASPDAIVEWVSATGLRPFLDPLDEGERAGFVAAYRARLDAAYPPLADGRRLLRFPRLFVVARK
jgi:trans-aconitate 2-methyltransferase